jgi:hypothetical protein
MWWKAILGIIFSIALLLFLAALYGANRWEAGTRELRSKLEAARISFANKTFNARELEGLPAVVQRYFRAALKDGQPMVAAASFTHSGTFNMSETAEQWKPFTSTQRVVTQRPGFDWDGRIAMMPMLNVHVHDAYVSGEGQLHASLLGLVTLANLPRTADLDQGELMRYFAEAAWYPTALLPSQGVSWEAIDDTSAKATLKDGKLSVSLTFHFNEAGLIDGVRADARARVVGGATVHTPWQGKFWSHELRNGMLVPLEGEVAWLLSEGPEGAKPYWRGRLQTVSYTFIN